MPLCGLWLMFCCAPLLQIAKRQGVVNPENTFFSVKRFIGRKMDEVKDESKQVGQRWWLATSSNAAVPCRLGIVLCRGGAALLRQVWACIALLLGCWQQHQLRHSLPAVCCLARAFACPGYVPLHSCTCVRAPAATYWLPIEPKACTERSSPPPLIPVSLSRVVHGAAQWPVADLCSLSHTND